MASLAANSNLIPATPSNPAPVSNVLNREQDIPSTGNFKLPLAANQLPYLYVGGK
jgi:hypothetical protein